MKQIDIFEGLATSTLLKGLWFYLDHCFSFSIGLREAGFASGGSTVVCAPTCMKIFYFLEFSATSAFLFDESDNDFHLPVSAFGVDALSASSPVAAFYSVGPVELA